MKLFFRQFFLISGLFFLFHEFAAFAQEDAGGRRLFQSDNIIKVRLTGNIDSIRRDIGPDATGHSATLSYLNENGREVILPVEVNTRGGFRKNPDNCDFPPLDFVFRKADVDNTIFEGQDELKVVTHCSTGNQVYEQLVFREYMVYRIYNELTPFSFRVRLLDITYMEESSSEEVLSGYAFLIERTRDMAERNGGIVLKLNNFSVNDMDLHAFSIFSVFQYMIENNDWSVAILHNVKLVSVDPLKPPFPVPYDFDWAGVVSAPYRVLATDTAENNGSDRLYKGTCRKRQEYKKLLEIFQEKRPRIYDLYRDFVHFSPEVRDESIAILDEFYDLITHPGKAIQEFRKNCLPQR